MSNVVQSPRDEGSKKRYETLEVEENNPMIPRPHAHAHAGAVHQSSERNLLVSKMEAFFETFNDVENLQCYVFGLVLTLLFVGIFAWASYSVDKDFRDIARSHGFELQTMKITNFSSSQSATTGGCDVIFNITNHGDDDLYYMNGIVLVYFQKQLLWSGPTNSFYQAAGDSSLSEIMINQTIGSTPDAYVPKAIERNRKFHEANYFAVRYIAWFREGLDNFFGRVLDGLEVACFVSMKFEDATTMSGGPAACTMKLSSSGW